MPLESSLGNAAERNVPILDASVYVSLIHERDRHHERCSKWLEQALLAGEVLAAPNLILPEVAASIRRLTGDEKLAAAVVRELRELRLVELVPLVARRTEAAAEIAARTGVRGADAVYLALADERGDVLVTVDRQQLARGGQVVSVLRP